MTDSNNSKLLVLVDGSSYLFRAYHALPPLTNSKGEPTGAVYGVLNMLRRLLKDYQPAHIAVVFDPKGKTFRDEIYPQYKANRDAMPEELRIQIKPLFEAIKALGFPLLIIDGVEADDVIGTLAVEAKKKGIKTLISTMDKDLAQLVNEEITLINTMSNHLYDHNAVVNKFGVTPEQIIDYFALMGDAIDNIPGVPKVGPKTAAKWLQQYGTLENLIQHAQDISGKVGENLRAHLQELPLSKTLVTVKLDVPLDITFEDLKLKEPDHQKLYELFSHLEFRGWLEELKKEKNVVPQTSAVNYSVILEKADFESWIKRLSDATQFAFDTETTSLNPLAAELVGLSFSLQSGEAAYVPVAHDYMGAPSQLNRSYVLEQLKPLLLDPTKTIIGQNLKYDMEVLEKYGIEVKAKIYDTLLESYVLNSTSSRHDMGTLALKYLGLATISFEDIAGKGVKQLTFNQIDLDKATQYAAEDADITLRLHEKLWPMIEAIPASKKILQQIEWPLVHVLTSMEIRGVLIDAQMLNQQSKDLEKRIMKLQTQSHQLAGVEFNLGSPKQLQAILYEKMQLPVLERTPTGQPSTAESVLQGLARNYELPKLILEYRSLSKLKSTYTDSLPLQINSRTGRVHTSYNQTVTSTGRLSSTDPNLQNIPIRTEEGRKIRQAFIAPPGYKIVAADYSQIELRIMAHLSKDPGLTVAFEKGEDVHARTASEIFSVALSEVTSDQRRSAKAINFGLMYGMSGFGLAAQLGIERGMAEKYINIYFARYPKVLEYMEQARSKAAEKGYVETIFGRRLYTPEIRVSNLQRRRAAERAAINAPLQGSAADIIKIAMITINEKIQQKKLDAHMIMQVHDELVFEVNEKIIQSASEIIRECMESAAKLSVKLLVDIGVGNNWDEAH